MENFGRCLGEKVSSLPINTRSLKFECILPRLTQFMRDIIVSNIERITMVDLRGGGEKRRNKKCKMVVDSGGGFLHLHEILVPA